MRKVQVVPKIMGFQVKIKIVIVLIYINLFTFSGTLFAAAVRHPHFFVSTNFLVVKEDHLSEDGKLLRDYAN